MGLTQNGRGEREHEEKAHGQHVPAAQAAISARRDEEPYGMVAALLARRGLQESELVD